MLGVSIRLSPSQILTTSRCILYHIVSRNALACGQRLRRLPTKYPYAHSRSDSYLIVLGVPSVLESSMMSVLTWSPLYNSAGFLKSPSSCACRGASSAKLFRSWFSQLVGNIACILAPCLCRMSTMPRMVRQITVRPPIAPPITGPSFVEAERGGKAEEGDTY